MGSSKILVKIVNGTVRLNPGIDCPAAYWLLPIGVCGNVYGYLWNEGGFDVNINGITSLSLSLSARVQASPWYEYKWVDYQALYKRE